MLDPADLLDTARSLAGAAGQLPPSDAGLRRAVSTAYYALFHKVLRAAAERFVGAGRDSSAGYNLIYRSFNHGHMKKICESLDVATLNSNLKRQLGRSAVSRDMRDFANCFPTLQQLRQLADYDPTASFLRSDVVSLINIADVAMAAFDRVEPDEKADILALLMVAART